MFPCCETGVLVATLLLSGITISAADAGLYEKALVFPYETNNSYVTLTPQKPMELKAFTLCMKVATELKNRRVFLFAYRTRDRDEFNVWQESDGRYSIDTGGKGTFFDIPPLSTFKTKICITWESTTGLSAFWVKGKRSIRKAYRQGYMFQPNGNIILGQDPDHYVGGFQASESFVGEISDVNMWDYVLLESQIKALQSCGTRHIPKGNIFDWETIEYQIHGTVFVASAD